MYIHTAFSLASHSFTDGHLDCFHHLALINSAAVNMGVKISFQNSNFIFFRYIPRSGMAGLYGGSIFDFSRNLHTLFHNGLTNLHSHQQCTSVPFSPRSCQHLLLLVFLVIAVLKDLS